MTLSLAEVEYIAELARLELTPEEKERFRLQLSEILEHVRRLQALDTSDIPPTASVVEIELPLRPDEPQPGLSLQELLRNAPEVMNEQFRVPPVLE